jgi:LysR family transcriptional activator for leuABCD operon
LIFTSQRARLNVLNDLRFGESWLALDYRPINEPGYRCEVVSEQEIVLIARKGHPRLEGGLTTELYQTLPQVALASVRTTSVLPVSERLQNVGLSRIVKFSVPGLLSAVRIVMEQGFRLLPLCGRVLPFAGRDRDPRCRSMSARCGLWCGTSGRR